MSRGPQGRPVVRKMLVVAPSSIAANWGKELQRWIGMARAPFLVLAPGPDAASQVTAFKAGNKWRVLVASYELIRKFCGELAGAVDLLVCDEGHRLKSAATSTTMRALLSLQCPRRVILTGTPANSRPMQPGDLVEVEVTGLGRLSNPVADIPAPAHDVGHQPTDTDSVRRVALGGDWWDAQEAAKAAAEKA